MIRIRFEGGGFGGALKGVGDVPAVGKGGGELPGGQGLVQLAQGEAGTGGGLGALDWHWRLLLFTN